MKIALGSDLHLEFGQIVLKNTENAEVLLLAGDILIANDMHEHPRPAVPYTPLEVTRLGTRQANAHRFRTFLDQVSADFPHVVVVGGNHEFYDGKWVASLIHLRSEYAHYPNVHFLERDTITIGDVVFVGGTLWTDMNKFDPLTLHAVTTMMTDYNLIRNDALGYTKLKPATTCERFKQTLGYFKLILDDHPDQKCVVVSHHSPSFLSCASWFKDNKIMNGAYHSSLEEFILDRPQIKLWVHGHTHEPFDYLIGPTRIVCNPRGYHNYEARAHNFELQFMDV